jgi:hypothetical protein
MRKWYQFGVSYKTFISIIRNFGLLILFLILEQKRYFIKEIVFLEGHPIS